MLLRDFAQLSLGSVLAHRMRSLLTALGITVGIASVVLLTSLGEGVKQYVLHEFSQFGTNLIGVSPGRTTTLGIPGGAIASVRPLTLADAQALSHIPHVEGIVPVVQGNAEVSVAGRSRRTSVLGAGPQLLQVWNAHLAMGRSLPADPPRTARAFAVLGSTLRTELFGNQNPLGARLRIGGETFRVIGVLASLGQVLGFNLDDAVYIPAGRAMALFNRDGLMEVDVRYAADIPSKLMADRIRKVLERRHGTEDFTITTQEDMLKTLNGILNILTLAVGALGGISLLVGAVGIFTIMNIGVRERTSEIGLLRALGAPRGQVLALFLGEAVVLAALGGASGLVLGVGGAHVLGWLIPALPVHTPWIYALLAEILAALIGLLAGVLPAQHAARLDPVEALREE